MLSVCGSGDQIINALYFGAEEVTGFDLNRKSKLIAKLKMEAVLYLRYQDFLKFFGEDKPNAGFSHQIYNKFKNKLDAHTKSFFDDLYKKFNYAGLKLFRSENFRQRDDFGHGAIKKINIYLKNEKNYEKIKDILGKKDFKFVQCGVKELQNNPKLISKKFEIINLSNIPGYITGSLRKGGSKNPIQEFYESILIGMRKLLSKDGKIIFYTYSNSVYPNKVARTKPTITSPNIFKKVVGEKEFTITSKKVSGLTKSTFDKLIILKKK